MEDWVTPEEYGTLLGHGFAVAALITQLRRKGVLSEGDMAAMLGMALRMAEGLTVPTASSAVDGVFGASDLMMQSGAPKP